MNPQRLSTRSREGKWLAGFSLLELIIVMLILGIVSAIAIPKYSASLDRYRAQVALQRLSQDIELCRRHARFTAQTVSMTVSFGKSFYRISPLDSPLRPGTPYQVILGEDSGNTFLCPVVKGVIRSDLRSTTSDLMIVFDRYGTPNSTAEIGVMCGSASAIVQLSAEGVISKS